MIFVLLLVFDILANIFHSMSMKEMADKDQHKLRDGDYCVRTDGGVVCTLGKENKKIEVDKHSDPNYWCSTQADGSIRCTLGPQGNWVTFKPEDIAIETTKTAVLP